MLVSNFQLEKFEYLVYITQKLANLSILKCSSFKMFLFLINIFQKQSKILNCPMH